MSDRRTSLGRSCRFSGGQQGIHIPRGIKRRQVVLSFSQAGEKDGEVQFRDAKDVWGLDNFKTMLRIQEEVGDKRVRVASIGQAGESGILTNFLGGQRGLDSAEGTPQQ